MAEENTTEDQQTEMLFMQLVMMFQGMAMQQLGKVMNPMTQKTERDLGQAKNFIDLLSMLEAKTKGNLGENESRMLQQALYDLRMNYVEEMKKGDQTEGGGEASAAGGDAAATAADSEADSGETTDEGGEDADA